ncbi:hypothetical protein K3495_g14473 [Podosphaera aphanis]|nr:hypothetical protein K3495_g14473 [Podosphaera aphanis]
MANIQPLSLPAEAQNASFEAPFSACQQHAREAGYAFSEQKSEERYGRDISHTACKRSGSRTSKYTDNDTFRKPLRTTQKTRCLVSLKARERIDGQ